jgi:ketosteroid isomerase-like protein
MYSQNALLLPPGADAIGGTESIAAFWKAVMDMGITEVKLETVSVESSGASTVEVGRYVLMAGAAAVDKGKYLVVWCLEGGSWKLHRDIWNTSAQPSK